MHLHPTKFSDTINISTCSSLLQFVTCRGQMLCWAAVSAQVQIHDS
jgi:hypothetical protein